MEEYSEQEPHGAERRCGRRSSLATRIYLSSFNPSDYSVERSLDWWLGTVGSESSVFELQYEYIPRQQTSVQADLLLGNRQLLNLVWGMKLQSSGTQILGLSNDLTAAAWFHIVNINTTL